MERDIHNYKINNKFVLIFPGQGSQYGSMGSEFLNINEKYLKYFEISGEMIGVDLPGIINNKDGKSSGLLDKTQFSQIAIYSYSCALNDYIIFDLGLDKDNIGAVIGHSLGDYSALYSSGAYEYKQGAAMVTYRGNIMGNIGRELEEKSGVHMMMTAVIGAGIDTVENILKKYKESVFLANYNDYEQVVISGIREDVLKAAEELKTAGARRVIELKVNTASHCPLMKEASEKLSGYLKENSFSFSRPVIDFFSSTELAFIDEKEIKNTLIRQLTNPVKWVDSIENLLNLGFRRFIEVGPGKVLSGLIKRIASRLGFEEVTILNTDNLKDLENLKNILFQKV